MDENIKSLHLKTLPQYHFERDKFVDIINEIYPNMCDDIYTHVSMNTDSFSFFRYEDEFYIIHRDSGTIINWYKHLGRTNTCNKNLSYDDLKEFIFLFKSEMLKETDSYEKDF